MRETARDLIRDASTRLQFRGRVRLVRALSRYLLPDRHPTLCGMDDGSLMLLDLRDPLQRDMYFGLYELGIRCLIAALLSPGDVFFDLGAHIGYYTIAAAKRVGASGSVHAFEALTSNANLLEKSVLANEFKHIRVNRVAVSNSSGTATLQVPRTNDHNVSGHATIMHFFADASLETVNTVSIDDYVESQRIAAIELIKMDIEAAEVLALRGMERTLNTLRLPRIMMEINSIRLRDAGYQPELVCSILFKYGYAMYKIAHGTLWRTENPSPESSLENVLFLPPGDPLLVGSPKRIDVKSMINLRR